MKSNGRRSDAGKLRLVGYVRVSTEEQAREGVSLGAQRERLTAYAVAHDAGLVGIETDEAISGKIPPSKRPGLARALATVRRGEADGLLVLKLDRLSRSTRDVLDLVDETRRGGWRLVSVSEHLDTGSAAGRLVVTVLAALSEMEREQIGERTRFALDSIARAGRGRGRFIRLGYRSEAYPDRTEWLAGDHSQLVEHAEEQTFLAEIQRLRGLGQGERTIAAALNRMGQNPRSGRAWTRSGVGSILRTLRRHQEAQL